MSQRSSSRGHGGGGAGRVAASPDENVCSESALYDVPEEALSGSGSGGGGGSNALVDEVLDAVKACGATDLRSTVAFILNYTANRGREVHLPRHTPTGSKPPSAGNIERRRDLTNRSSSADGQFVTRLHVTTGTKTALAALGSDFFDREQFPGRPTAVLDYLQQLSPRQCQALWGAPVAGGEERQADEVRAQLGGTGAVAGTGAVGGAGSENTCQDHHHHAQTTTPTQTTTERRLLAVYPGSFNPPTRAHKAIAEHVVAMPSVAALWVDLTTPYKQKQLIAEVVQERRDMVDLVLHDLPTAGCAALMEAMGGSGNKAEYFDVVRSCAGPNGRVGWVVGSDVVMGMRFWRDKAKELLTHVDTLIVFPRDELESDGYSLGARLGNSGKESSVLMADSVSGRRLRGDGGGGGAGKISQPDAHAEEAERTTADGASSDGRVHRPADVDTHAVRRRLEAVTELCWSMLEDLFEASRRLLAEDGRVVFRSIPAEFQALSSSRGVKLVDRALRHIPSNVLGYIADRPGLRRHYGAPVDED